MRLHQCHVVKRRAGGRKAGRGLDEIRVGFGDDIAHADLLIFAQQAGLDNHLERMPRAGRLDRVDFGEHLVVSAVLEHADVDDHVHLVRAVLHRVGGLKHLRLRRGIAGRETDHRAHAHLVRFILHIRLAARDIAGRDAHRRRVIFHRVIADGLDLRPRRFGLEQRMIHHREHLAEFHFLFLLHGFLQNGKPRRHAEKTAFPASNRRVSDRFHYYTA